MLGGSKCSTADAAPQMAQVIRVDGTEICGHGSDVMPDEKPKKPIRFYLGFLSLLIMVFIVSVDATALAVVVPVSY